MALLFSPTATAPPIDLIEAAFVAEGASKSELEAERRRLDAWAEELQRFRRNSDSERGQIEAVFSLLHREILTGEYSKPASDLRGALHGGDYNCVAATILFVALCERCDLQPQIWSAPGHVLCRFPGNPPLDVETTCPDWFAAGRRDAKPRAGLRQISREQLIGKVHYNRGILLLEKGQFPQALAELRMSARLDPQDCDARDNLLAGLNNAAIAACAENQFAQATELLAEARQIDPHYPPLQANDVHVHQRWVVQLCGAGQYADALELLEQGLARHGSAPLYDRGRLTVYDLWARERLAAGALDDARTIVAQGLAVDPAHAALLRTQQQIAAAKHSGRFVTSPAAQSAAQ